MSSTSICERCIEADGGCCIDVEISIHSSEGSEFFKRKQAGSLPEGHSIKKDSSDPDVFEYSSNGGPCMFLGDDKKCTIYDQRPLICRTYPVQWAKSIGKFDFYLDCSCPLSQELPLREFSSWISKLPRPELVELIGELDFNTNATDYINLTVINELVSPKLVNSDKANV